MEITEKYANLVERKQKITLREGQSYRMVSDTFDPDWEYGDEPHGTMIFTDEPLPRIEPQPPQSTHLSTLISVTSGVRPARVKRVWHGVDYFYDCYVTQTVKDEYISGKIVIGDYVLVHYDNELNEQIVTAKVYKSW